MWKKKKSISCKNTHTHLSSPKDWIVNHNPIDILIPIGLEQLVLKVVPTTLPQLKAESSVLACLTRPFSVFFGLIV